MAYYPTGLVVIPAGTSTPISIEIQPGVKVEQVKLLLIKSSLYSGEGQDQKITYSIDDSDKEIELDQLHLYVGSGTVSVLGNEPPKILNFKNTYPAKIPTDFAKNTPEQDVSELNKAQLSILVGRDATPDV